ncbi:MAG TPA: acyltransferase domain-containing protein [Duganella sp.]|jgi:[acyl-carrier-protein] S-malonyltransferase
MSYGAQSRLLLLCPGQGAQHRLMFDLARTNAGAGALLDRLAGAMPPGAGAALTSASFSGALDALGTAGASQTFGIVGDQDIFANRNAQPLIVAATLAMWESIREFAPAPALVAGYSIGELSAYGVAGALKPEEAVALAAQRARLMDACLAAHPGQALVALSGLALNRVVTLTTAHDFHISIETGDDSCIAGGPAESAHTLELAVIAAGGRCTRLPVEVASHTPYMRAAVEPFAQALRQSAFGAMTAPVLAGISAMAVTEKIQAVEQLSRQLAEKIRWLACMDACAEGGITYALELGPGSALSKMMQARHPHINTRSVADFRTLDGIRKWLERAAE